MRISVLGTEFNNITLTEARKMAEHLIVSEGKGYIVTPNPEIVMMCRKDPELQKIVNDAFLVLPDGIGIILGARILGRPLKEKVAGIEFAEAVICGCAKKGHTVYLLGAKPGVAEMAAESLKAKYPGLKIVGTADGYFKNDEPVIDEINSVRPDVLFVCLGAPRQEIWMSRNISRLDVHLAAGLGGSLDVFAGIAQRAPEKWRNMGLEWLYRLKKEPRRIGRMMKLPAFLIKVVWRRIFYGDDKWES
jgi:N-acetylglucosaminyldiphosphoundecaprenol N-acetyl-beta-D-mannosaminyltransferase